MAGNATNCRQTTRQQLTKPSWRRRRKFDCLLICGFVFERHTHTHTEQNRQRFVIALQMLQMQAMTDKASRVISTAARCTLLPQEMYSYTRRADNAGGVADAGDRIDSTQEAADFMGHGDKARRSPAATLKSLPKCAAIA